VLGIASIQFVPIVVVGLAALACGLLSARWRPPDAPRSDLATAGSVLAALSLAGVFPCLILEDPDRSAEYTRIPVVEFGVGDCVEREVQEEQVIVTACSSKHDGEVVGLLEDPTGTDAPYPGEPALESHARGDCSEPFESYVDIPLEESDLEIKVFLPIEHEWQSGIRRIVCVAGYFHGSSLYSSVRQSQR
jgi:hypothetical protein